MVEGVIPPALLAILRCPVTGTPLRPSDEHETTACMAAFTNARPLPSFFLVNEPGTVAYPVIDDIPVLLTT